NVQAAVICSTDALYKEIVEPLARSLKHVQPDIRVILAGYPPDEVPDFETYGIDAFIHAQANIYAINQQLQEWLGVSS
ncbi:MAG: methylmalonyl-CoA mutase, partial [Anaerolineae bacterium]|nr:methylmalonyl-CoA mutase [Anaerolineae bacterium]